MEVFSNSMPLLYSYAAYTSTSPFTTTTTNTSNSTTHTSHWMDSRIWSKLPQKLVDRVIVFLPLPAFYRARSVCKRWYALLFSNNFLQLYLQVSPQHHWFLFFKHKTTRSYIYTNNNGNGNGNDNDNGETRDNREGYMFDPYETKWYRIPFSVIPSGFSPVASSGGLVCWVSDEAGTKSLILSNPLLGSLTPLPPTLRPRLFPSIGFNVGLTSIDVTLAGDDLISPYAVKNLSTENFHIDAGGFYSLWGTTSALPRLCSLESSQMIHVDTKFYSMNHNPYSVLVYQISSNTWLKIQAPMRRFLRSPSLVNCRDKLVLIAAVEKSKLNVPQSLRLWGLQSCGTTWVEVERMPQQLYLEFAEMECGSGFDCVGHGEFVVITIKGCGKSLLFDMCRKRWQWVPQCPYVYQSSRGDDEMHGFAYEPRLATPVTALLDQLTLTFQPF